MARRRTTKKPVAEFPEGPPGEFEPEPEEEEEVEEIEAEEIEDNGRRRQRVGPGFPGYAGAGFPYDPRDPRAQQLPPVETPAWITKLPGETARLKVQRIEEDGQVSDLGAIHANATQEQIIARHKKPGIYQVIPIDNLNEELGKPHRFTVAPDHAYFLAQGGAGAMGVAGTAPADPMLMSLFERMFDQQNALETSIQTERKEIADQRVETAKIQGAQQVQMIDQLISMQRAGQQADTDRHQAAQKELLEMQQRDRDRSEQLHQRTMESQSALHQAVIAQSQAMAEAAVAQAQASAQMTVEAFKHQDTVRREDSERRERRETDANKERAKLDTEVRKQQDSMREERERERREHWAREEKQSREHRENQLALTTRQLEAQGSGGLTQLGDQIESVKALGELLNPKESGGLMGLAEKAIEGFSKSKVEEAKAQVELAKAQMGEEWDEDEGPEGVAPPQIPMNPAGAPALLASEGEAEPAINVSGSGIFDTYGGGPAGVAAGGVVPAGGGVQPQPGQPMGQPAPLYQQPGQPPQPAQIPTSPTSGLPLETLRVARRTIRSIIDQLRVTDPTEWQTIVVGNLTQEPRVIDYLRVGGMTVFKACLEGGAEPDMAQGVVNAVAALGIEGIALS